MSKEVVASIYEGKFLDFLKFKKQIERLLN